MTIKSLLFGLVAITQYSLAAPVDEGIHFDAILARSASAQPIIQARDRPVLSLRPVQAPADQEPTLAQQIVPQSSVNLHYAGSSAENSTQVSTGIVSVPNGVTYPVVNAVGASLITGVECSGNQARVTFASQDAFTKAASTWSKAGKFSLVTFSDSCGTGLDDATHDFLLVDSIVSHSAEGLSVLVNYNDIQLEDAIGLDTLISVRVGNVPKPAERWSIGPINIPNPLDIAIGGSYSKNINWNKYPTNAASPWGPAYRLYGSDKLTAYCVGCGADGALTLVAAAQFTLRGQIKTGSVSVRGSMNAAVVFGFVGTVGVTVPLPEITLAQLSIEGLSVPGIFSIGPVATIAAGGSINVKAAGQLEAGAKLHFPNVQATLDIVNSGANGISGWQPTVEPVFNAAGKISSTLDLHLTNTLAFGVSIPKIKFDKQVALIDQPGVQVTAAIEGTVGLNDGKVTGGLTGSCKGVSISANFYNHLTANIFNIKTFKLSDWTSAALTKCIVIPGLASAPEEAVHSSSTRQSSTSTKQTSSMAKQSSTTSTQSSSTSKQSSPTSTQSSFTSKQSSTTSKQSSTSVTQSSTSARSSTATTLSSPSTSSSRTSTSSSSQRTTVTVSSRVSSTTSTSSMLSSGRL